MSWRSLKDETPPKDGGAFLVLGNEDIAVAWYDPTAGATWCVMHLPGRGVTICDRLYQFHSWCPASDMQNADNMIINPRYYGLKGRTT